MITWEISLGSILTCVSIVVMGIGFYWQTVIDSRNFKSDIVEIKMDLKILNKVITDVALQNQRLDNQGDRLNRIDIRMDELRHGRGYITP